MNEVTKKTKAKKMIRRPQNNINVRSSKETIAKFKFVCDTYSMSQREFIEKSIESAYTLIGSE